MRSLLTQLSSLILSRNFVHSSQTLAKVGGIWKNHQVSALAVKHSLFFTRETPLIITVAIVPQSRHLHSVYCSFITQGEDRVMLGMIRWMLHGKASVHRKSQANGRTISTVFACAFVRALCRLMNKI